MLVVYVVFVKLIDVSLLPEFVSDPLPGGFPPEALSPEVLPLGRVGLSSPEKSPEFPPPLFSEPKEISIAVPVLDVPEV